MRIVVDTNVLISGIYLSGTPNKILDSWANDKLDILITKDILSEYFDVINRIDPKNKNAERECLRGSAAT